MRIQRIALEHHGNVALFRHDVVDHRVADVDLALGWVLEAGDDAQQRALAAARWAEQDHELAISDIEVDVFDSGDAIELLSDVL